MPAEKVLSDLQVHLLLPYSQLSLSSRAELPDSCLAFGLQAKPTCWFYIFSEAEDLQQTRAELRALLQVSESLTFSLSCIFRRSQWFGVFVFVAFC